MAGLVKSRSGEVISASPKPRKIKVVTYDLEEFAAVADPGYPVRYTVHRRSAGGYHYLLVFRLYGVDRRGSVVVYEECSEPLLAVVDEARAGEVLSRWREVVERLGARPGRYEAG